MNQVESHIIKNSNSNWSECDSICFKSKNLYNYSLYLVKNHYENTKSYLPYHELTKKLSSENQVDYRALPAKVSQQTLMILDRNMKSFFQALKAYNKNPSKFTGKPFLPKFKHKVKGRFITAFTQQTISLKDFKKGFLTLSGTKIKLTTKLELKNIQQVRIIPLRTGSYKIEIVYSKQEKELVKDNNNYCGIDVGLNNLLTVTFNDKSKRNIVINGRPLKSINQYYNKKKAYLQSRLPKGQYVSKKINKLTEKRNNKVKDYVHKSTKKLVDILKHNDICKVIIGKNEQWKTGINIGKKNNQNFVSLPHAMSINVLQYKLLLQGIDNSVIEESYTSKCSAYDGEAIKKHDEYVGKRVKRGLFRSKDGYLLNADVNGGANILRKAIPKAFANGMEGLLVSPMVINLG